jgi:hypothetical protein
MIDTYTRMLETVAELADAPAADSAVHKLILHLRSAGRLRMLPQIVRELRKIAARKHALRPRVEVAHEKEATSALAAAAARGIDAPRALVNPALISGWRAQKAGILVDRSTKRALVDIYQNIIA